ncbi:MAG: asparagine synthase [Thermoplasmata archaeon]|nr:asparagine synthase [Thermoplasmata archaeon]
MERAAVLAQILREETQCRKSLAVAFSGGLDSGIIAYLLRDCGAKFYTVGIEGSRDFKNAKDAAKLLNLDLETLEIGENDVLEGLLFLKRVDPEISVVEASFELPLYFVCSYAPENSIVTGQGSDEIFGGYKKYLEKPKLMKEDLERLLNRTWPREKRIATLLGKELLTPYLSKRVLEFSLTLPAEMKIRNGVRKYILREAAKFLGVPESIYMREKKAAQYGSGIWKMMKRMAKKDGKSVEEFFASL